MSLFADVTLPIPLSDSFTYAVPAGLEAKIKAGYRVVVPFGKKKHYTAIVLRVHDNAPKGVEIKEIRSCMDSHPVVNKQHIDLWEWISFYYLSPLGDVYKAALPSILKPQDLEEKYKPKTETFVRLNKEVHDIAPLLGRAKKQAELYRFLHRHFVEKGIDKLPRKEITANREFSHAVIQGLIEKGILVEFTEDISRIDKEIVPVREPFPLNRHQQKALDEINRCFDEKNVCLLHGITSSGKTEIYIHLIREQLRKKKQTLCLVPEIALTTQLTFRLKAVFGEKVGIYHSKISDNERAEIWQKMLSDSPYGVIIGVRSSLFLPFRNLSLVIVDEEHEASYKQQDPAPRYHARDTAIVLANIFGAKTLLGSATPSLETYYNTQTGKYGLVTLNKRFEEIELPQIILENTFELRRKKKMKSALAPALIEKMNEALAQGQQVILFRNRRGFAPVLECKLCGWTPKCTRCDVSLAYHKYRNELKCHYCDKSCKAPKECPVCHEKSIEPMGLGTEKLEEEVAQLFPHYPVARMDTDTTRGKRSYEAIIRDFETGKIKILVGTQMLSKGLDFENVSVVGIISADSLLNYPDFRSHERGFQLMMQAAGRAGRKNRRGTVFIQTASPQIPIYRQIVASDYLDFYNTQLAERKLFRYPPFTRLISIVFKHKNEQITESGAYAFARMLKKSLGDMVLGPNKPIVSRIRMLYIREILLKLDNNLSPTKIRELIKTTEARFRENSDYKYMIIYFDVDKIM